jgi:GH43 family beta-xylosidase
VRCYASGNAVTIALAQKLPEIEVTFARAKVWTAPVGTMYSRNVWAPEAHFLNNRWYIYFAADDSLNKNHRMYVLESAGTDPMGPYTFKGRITPLVDRWAIDGTVLTRDGISYFVWSGWEGFSGPQNLYISKMLNPWTIDTGKIVTRIEAENAKLTNANMRATTSASGGKCAAGIDYADSKAEFTISVASAGTYLLKAVFANGSTDWSTHTVTVNGVKQDAIRYPVTGWEKWYPSTALVNLKAGSNVIALGKGDRNAELDYVALYANTVDRVCISRPELAWEKLTSAINEGPEALSKGSTMHIVYSASASWTDNYCLGVLTLTGTNPLDIASWTKHPQTVFTKTDKVFGPGHCSFVKSPDGTENWIVYHAAKTQGSGWSRKVLTQPFTWNSSNFPVFGTPIPDSVPINVPSGTNPYYAVPGRVQANHYYLMNGIQLQRTQDVSGEINVTGTGEGDWLEYRLDVKTPGIYTVDYRVASDTAGGIVELRSGSSLLNTMSIPTTGGTQTWTTVQNEIRLPAGQQTLRLNVVKGGFNLNWLDLQYKPRTEVTQYFEVPGRVQAEDYYQMNGVDIQPTLDSSGTYNIGWLHAGDWLEYRLNVKTAGLYKVDYRVASGVSGGNMQILLGSSLLDTLSIPNTGSSQSWTNVQNEIELPAGQQTVRVNIVKGGFNINWIDFQPASPSSVTPRAINLSRGSGLHYYEVFDLSGRLVKSGVVPAAEARFARKMKGNLNTQSRGIYLVKVYKTGDKKTNSVVVKSMLIK